MTTTPLMTYLLLVLAQGPQHGYALKKRVAEESAGHCNPGLTVLYSAIGRMMEHGWLRESPAPIGSVDDRRKFYAITLAGQAVLAEAADLQESFARTARSRLQGVVA